MSINELQDEVIAEFSDFDDWMDRYQLLIDLGNEQEPLDEKYKTEQNLIEGCQSRVWLQADDVDGKIVFNAESDALIVKGIIALLIKVLSGHTPDEILNADLYFIDKIGLRDHLSPTRSNGLLSMVKQIRMYALAFKAKEVNYSYLIISSSCSLMNALLTISALIIFVMLILSINKSQIFEWKNVRRLRWLGSLLIMSFVFYLIPQVVNYWGLKEVFALEHYIIAPLALQTTDLLLGLGCLIVAETFAIGLKMKEEQELTI